MQIMDMVSTEFLMFISIVIGGGVFLWNIQRVLTADISEFRKEVKQDIKELGEKVNAVEKRIALVEGLLMPTSNITHPQNIEQS